MSYSTSAHDLKVLVQSYQPLVVLETVEEERMCALLAGVADELSMPLFEWSITQGLRRSGGGDLIYGTQEVAGVLQHLAALRVEGLFLLKDFSGFLSDPAAARAFREAIAHFRNSRSTILLSGDPIELPREIESQAAFCVWQPPSAAELTRTVHSVVQSLKSSGQPVAVELSKADFKALVDALSGLTLNQARQAVAYASLEDQRLSAEDVTAVAGRKAALFRDGSALEFFPPGDNDFEIGGFERLREWIARARTGFSAEARAMNLDPPRGILLVGIQGCGKSLAAKFIGRQWDLPLLKLDAGSLYEKYVGESEKNFRRAISVAESMAPCVLWIDEIEKAIAVQSSGDADGGLSRRLFGAFLSWLQEKRAPVFVVATANDVMGLPPELLRKGRFDEIFFVDLPEASERDAIFRIHLELRKQDAKGFDLTRLVSATDGFSGAEIEQAVISGLYRALHAHVPLTTELLELEIRETVPLSVSRRESIEQLRSLARDRFVPVR